MIERKRGRPWQPLLQSYKRGELLRRSFESGRGRIGRGGGSCLLGSLRLVLTLLFHDQVVAMRRDGTDLVHDSAGAGRDQAADDDVLLEAVERIRLAVDGSFGKDARRLLERS